MMTIISKDSIRRHAWEVLKASGEEMTTRAWFASDPRLAACTDGERRSIVMKLHHSGYIVKGDRVRAYTTPDGKPCQGVKLTTWRARRWPMERTASASALTSNRIPTSARRPSPTLWASTPRM